MYENEEIEEKVGRSYAKEGGAIFKYTSAKNNSGVEELFRSIGSKYIDPNYDENNTNNNHTGNHDVVNDSSVRNRGTTMKLNNTKLDNSNNKNKKCC